MAVVAKEAIGDDGVIDIHLRGQLAPPVRHGEAVLTAVKRVADATGEEARLMRSAGTAFQAREIHLTTTSGGGFFKFPVPTESHEMRRLLAQQKGGKSSTVR
ncbi:unnamed protein product [Closterium sp. NIES-53]